MQSKSRGFKMCVYHLPQIVIIDYFQRALPSKTIFVLVTSGDS